MMVCMPQLQRGGVVNQSFSVCLLWQQMCAQLYTIRNTGCVEVHLCGILVCFANPLDRAICNQVRIFKRTIPDLKLWGSKLDVIIGSGLYNNLFE